MERIININGKEISPLIDTGSDIRVTNFECYAKIWSPRLFNDNITLSSIGNEVIHPMGYFAHELCID